MPRYSIKRRRNIRKYKKSRRGRGQGRGRGRGSTRTSKPIKSKVFRKSRRNNIVKRRRMVGGEWTYSFRLSLDEIKKLFQKYPELKDIYLLESITIVGYGVAMVTKSSVSIRTNHRVEQVVAVRYLKGGKYFIAIIRCKVPDICLYADQCDTTLFIDPQNLGYTDVDFNSSDFKYKDDFVQHLVEKELGGTTEYAIMALNFGMFTFSNMHGDKGSYRLVLCKDNQVLSPNFPKKVKTANTANTTDDNLFYIPSFRHPLPPTVPTGGADPPPANIFKLFEYIYNNKESNQIMSSLPAVDYPPPPEKNITVEYGDDAVPLL